jgi:hypothetical protein
VKLVVFKRTGLLLDLMADRAGLACGPSDERLQASPARRPRAMCGRLRVGKSFLHVPQVVGAAMMWCGK